MAKQYGSNSPYPGDTIDGKLEQGEYVMNRNVLAIPGMKEYLDKLNYEIAPRYAQGGKVDGYAFGGFVKSMFDKFKAPAGLTNAGDFDLRNMTPAARKMAVKDISDKKLRPQASDESDFQDWAGRPSDFAMSAGTSDEEDYQEAFGEPSITSKYMKEAPTPDYMKDSLGSKLLSKFKKQDETVVDSPSEEELFFSQKYGSAPIPSEEVEPEAGSETYDPHGIFKASEDYNPLAPEAPQKMGLKESLRGFGEKAGHFLEQNVQFPAIQAGIDAKEGLGNLHKYLGAGKAENYQDVLTGKEKGSLYQRAGKGLGMLSSLMSEFAAPGQGRGNLKGYGRYKGDDTPALGDVAPSRKVDSDTPVAENVKKGPILGPDDEVGDYAEEMGLSREEAMEDITDKSIWGGGLKDISKEIADRNEVVLEEPVADVPASSTATNQNLNLSGGINPDPRSPWYGSDIDYSLNPEEVEEKAGGGLIGRAYQNGDYAHSNLDNMISLNHYQEGGMVSGNNSRRMFDFMKKRRY